MWSGQPCRLSLHMSGCEEWVTNAALQGQPSRLSLMSAGCARHGYAGWLNEAWLGSVLSAGAGNWDGCVPCAGGWVCGGLAVWLRRPLWLRTWNDYVVHEVL